MYWSRDLTCETKGQWTMAVKMIKIINESFLCLRVLEELWVINVHYWKSVVDGNLNTDEAMMSKGRYLSNWVENILQKEQSKVQVRLNTLEYVIRNKDNT